MDGDAVPERVTDADAGLLDDRPTVVEEARVHRMGTVIDLRVEGKNARQLLAEAVDRLGVYEHRFSANDPSSELGELNRAAGKQPVAVHPQLFELIALGVEHSLARRSMLNIAIGPLVQLWRIGFPDARVPDPAQIEAALELCDPAGIDLDEDSGRVYLRRVGMKLDLGAIAKGYIADLVVGFLRAEGVRSALINLGGNVLTYGRSPGQSDGRWRVGLRHPAHPDDQLAGFLVVDDGSVVTSGVYQRKLQRDGKVFHHLLDPATGYPIDTEVTSLTVVSDRSVDGEIWTSRLFGRPVREILQTLASEAGHSGVVITEDLGVFSSAGLRDRLVIGNH